MMKKELAVFECFSVILLCLLALTCSAVAKAAERPNVLLVITDDQSWCHLGCYGNPDIKTPHFDAFAKESMLFTNAYCQNASCAPSRASGTIH